MSSNSTSKKDTSKKETKTEKAKKFLTWSRIVYMAGTFIILLVLLIPWTNGGPNYPLQKGTQMVDDLSGSKERYEEFKTTAQDNFTAFVNESIRTYDDIYATESDYWNEYHAHKRVLKTYPVDIGTLECTLLNASEEDKPAIEAKIAEKKARLAEAQAYFDNLEE